MNRSKQNRSVFTANAGKLIFALAAITALVFSACNRAPAPFTDLNAISSHLANARGGTLERPIFMVVNLPLGDMTNAGSGWQRLLMIIENSGKNVSIDLSSSQMTGTEFNPVAQVSNGKFFIVSLVLPDAARSLIGSRDSSSFAHFYNLRTVSAKEITSIGQNAFRDCTSLISADFPMVASIAEGAFSGCSSLDSVNLPLVTSIGNSAFFNCSNLTSMSITLATSIGETAFGNCTSLTSVNFPASAALIHNPFQGASSLASFTLNGTGDLSVIEDGRALVRNSTELVAYPSASGNIVLDNITLVGRSAFNGNSDLSSISLPAATTISIRAFRSCTSLISANFPVVTAFGLGVFENTGTTALTVTLGERAPTLGGGMFAGVTGAKPVTVRVPAGASGYAQSPVNLTANNWGNRFRGGVWERREDWWGEVTFNRTVAPNANIELSIEFLTE